MQETHYTKAEFAAVYFLELTISKHKPIAVSAANKVIKITGKINTLASFKE